VFELCPIVDTSFKILYQEAFSIVSKGIGSCNDSFRKSWNMMDQELFWNCQHVCSWFIILQLFRKECHYDCPFLLKQQKCFRKIFLV